MLSIGNILCHSHTQRSFTELAKQLSPAWLTLFHIDCLTSLPMDAQEMPSQVGDASSLPVRTSGDTKALDRLSLG